MSKISEQVLEQLSALADDELDAAEARLLLARIEREPALREAWSRYHLAGEAMRGNLSRFHFPELAGRVMSALEREPAPAAPRRMPRWLKPAAGLAVAATVATVAVLGVQQQAVGPLPAEVVPQSAGNGVPALPYAGLRNAAWGEEAEPQPAEELAPYLEQHNRYATRRSMQGMLPYAHIVVYQRSGGGDERTADRAGGRDAPPERR